MNFLLLSKFVINFEPSFVDIGKCISPCVPTAIENVHFIEWESMALVPYEKITQCGCPAEEKL